MSNAPITLKERNEIRAMLLQQYEAELIGLLARAKRDGITITAEVVQHPLGRPQVYGQVRLARGNYMEEE